jgi:dCMP deaminase
MPNSTDTGSPATALLRPTWDDTWIGAARVFSQRSLCDGAQVGAVIVASDNRVLASGYNGPPRAFQHDDDSCRSWCPRSLLSPGDRSPGYDDCPSLHAEANAISVCDHPARSGGTLYVTSHVCFACAKLIANSGVARVVVRTDREDAHRRPEASYQFLGELGIALSVTAPNLRIFLAPGAHLVRSR